MMRHAGIVGAGILGRLLALELTFQGWRVTIFDKSENSGRGGCAYAAGGMLSPVIEALTQDLRIYEWGMQGIQYWQQLLPKLSHPVFFQQQGTLVIAHPSHDPDLKYTAARLRARLGSAVIQETTNEAMKELEPELSIKHGYLLPGEAQIDARALLEALQKELEKNSVSSRFQAEVTEIVPYHISIGKEKFYFDCVFDCRGIEARNYFSDLRSVRGELIYLHAPDVQINRVIRALHSRYPVYIIPRPNHVYLVGATEIETQDDSPVSVRSCLELLSAAYSVHTGFAEARIIEMVTGLRPAFSDNLPRIEEKPGLIRINGLYRHGFLIAPVMVQEALRCLLSSRASCLSAR